MFKSLFSYVSDARKEEIYRCVQRCSGIVRGNGRHSGTCYACHAYGKSRERRSCGPMSV